MGRIYSVGVATRLGIDGSGIESRLGRSPPPPVQAGPEVHLTSSKIGPGSLPLVKAAGAWRWSPVQIRSRSSRKIRALLPVWDFFVHSRAESTLTVSFFQMINLWCSFTQRRLCTGPLFTNIKFYHELLYPQCQLPLSVNLFWLMIMRIDERRAGHCVATLYI